MSGRIQRVGSEWSSQPEGSLRWWDQDPLEVIGRLDVSGRLPTDKDQVLSVAHSTLDLIGAAEAFSGPWGYSHCDHKPENALSVVGVPAVLDWDECGHIHPRLEAIESALRWSGRRSPGTTLTWPRQHLFVAFLEGYEQTGIGIHHLEPPDFAKSLAALLGWFAFQARRSRAIGPLTVPPSGRGQLRWRPRLSMS